MQTMSVLLFATVLVLCAVACSSPDTGGSATDASASGMDGNPFLLESDLPFQLPPFDRIDETDYVPAFEGGMAEQLKEIEVIAEATDAPTVENTLIPLELSGRVLERVQRVFFALSSADTNDELDSIEQEMAPRLSAHRDKILLNPKLFARIQALCVAREELDLDAETRRLIEEYHTDFVRAGAELSDAAKERLRAINAELATLETTFSQNVLAEVNTGAVVVDTREELAGLSENEIAATAEAAAARELNGKHVIPLRNTSGQPALSSLENRALRERIMRAALSRGSRGGEYDNRVVVVRMTRLRAERAALLGYANHAAYTLEAQTAGTVEAVDSRLASLTPRAAANARREAADLQAVIDAEGGDLKLSAWDWAYYAEKVRTARYAFDESQLRPYFELDTVLQNGVFHAANRLYGLRFKERTDLPVYHPDVRVFEVTDADGEPLGLFLGDFYARPSKRGGAWMSAYVQQSHLLGTRAVVANHLNVPKPPVGEPTLLTFDAVTTMFHEFGHALHALFSDVRYPYFAGTSVPRDFVEYPSQVNEMWVTWPEVLQNYAVHYETGEPMPAALIDKVLTTAKFNQGFATTEYLAASLLDQAWHQLTPDQVPDADGVLAFEAAALEASGVALDAIPPRYRSTYFSHIFSGGYSAGYYSYIWSEVLDADSVEWFKENGGLTRENGDHFRRTLLSWGGSRDAMELFKNFRGAEPNIAPLLERRGLN
jgi:peptidyl-dipeptidase Dcp